MSDIQKDPVREFEEEKIARIAAYAKDQEWLGQSNAWVRRSFEQKYMYNFNWLGRPIIQFPQDILAMQEIIFSVKPDLIIETGIAHGGSIVFYASMLELNAACGGTKDAEVLGIDIDVRSHNRKEIEAHPMFKRISMIEGSSLSESVVAQARAKASGKKKVMVCLDSNHTHEHVLAELEAYAPLTSVGSYCIAFDTIVEDVPKDLFPDRPWGPGNNPKTAVHEYLKGHPEFLIDADMHQKLMITVAPDGFLKRIG